MNGIVWKHFRKTGGCAVSIENTESESRLHEIVD